MGGLTGARSRLNSFRRSNLTSGHLVCETRSRLNKIREPDAGHPAAAVKDRHAMGTLLIDKLLQTVARRRPATCT